MSEEKILPVERQDKVKIRRESKVTMRHDRQRSDSAPDGR
jgi:hypothetical protein